MGPETVPYVVAYRGLDGLRIGHEYEGIQGLPIFRLGYSHVVTDVEWLPLRPYEHWAQDLKKLAQG
jgi:hypothetical protein